MTLRAIAVAAVAVVHGTPPGVFSNDSISPKFSFTTIPAPERGGDGRRNVFVFRRQNARAALEELHPRAEGVEDRSDLRLVPPPITSIDAGTEVRPQASLCVLVNSNPGTSSRRLIPPVQRMIFPPVAAARSWFRSCADRRTARRRRVRTPTRPANRSARAMSNRHARRGDLADPREQPRVIQHRLIDRDAVLPELPSLSHQPGRMGQRPDGDRPIVCCHAAKGVPSNEPWCVPRSGAQRSDNPCRSRPMTSTSIIYRHLPVQRDSEAPSGQKEDARPHGDVGMLRLAQIDEIFLALPLRFPGPPASAALGALA